MLLLGLILKVTSSQFLAICPSQMIHLGHRSLPQALQLCCVTALFADIEKEGPKRLWQPRPRRRRLGRSQPRVRGQVQENKRGHWSDDQQTETVCKYHSLKLKPSSHLSFLSFPFSPLCFLSLVSSFTSCVPTTHLPCIRPSIHLCGCGTWQALSKKENKGSESPELETALILTPRTEEKYKQINEEFDHMIKTHKIPVSTGLTLCRNLSSLTKCWLTRNGWTNPANHQCLPLE